jgi:hypothetical protein
MADGLLQPSQGHRPWTRKTRPHFVQRPNSIQNMWVDVGRWPTHSPSLSIPGAMPQATMMKAFGQQNRMQKRNFETRGRGTRATPPPTVHSPSPRMGPSWGWWCGPSLTRRVAMWLPAQSSPARDPRQVGPGLPRLPVVLSSWGPFPLLSPLRGCSRKVPPTVCGG